MLMVSDEEQANDNTAPVNEEEDKRIK